MPAEDDYVVPDLVPLDLDGVRTLRVGTAVWAVALVVLIALHSRLEAAGHSWWIWTCAAGLGLGLIGCEHTTRLRRRRRASDPTA